MKLNVAISTCPNDTFAFHGLLNEKIDTGDFELNFHLDDIQALNQGIMEGKFHFAKGSFSTALQVRERFGIMSSGSAIGFGVGPLLLSAEAGSSKRALVLSPGAGTTAHLLLRVLKPHLNNIETCVFSEIMPRLQRGEADLGVVIHEGRFTYQEHDLHLVSDLGSEWEELTGKPLPLGGLLGDLSLADEVLLQFNQLVHESIQYAFSHREEAFATMRKYAQELSEAAIWKHVELYVNEFTQGMGEVGIAAMNELDARHQATENSMGTPIAAPLRFIGV